MAIADRYSPNRTDGADSALPHRTPQALTTDGAITIADGLVTLSKAGVLAATIASPPTDMPGCELEIVALTANAHTVTYSTTGFNDGGTASDVATFGGAKGDSMRLRGINGIWYVVSTKNVTLG